MQLVKYQSPTGQPTVGVLEAEHVRPVDFSSGQYRTMFDLFEDASDLSTTLGFLVDQASRPLPVHSVPLLAPIDQQEVWAAGVTYKRSQAARMQESEHSASVYDRVYDADRPELFYKSNASRVSGPGRSVRIRRDSKWNVPEPELALVLNSKLELVGYTIGNDMSSRDIEGENPLYLPQAKMYDYACALGPAITLLDFMPPRSQVEIRMKIYRRNQLAFEGETNLGEMHRSFENLIDYLGREMTFPHGVFLLTGTGIIPDDGFTLSAGDSVEISIDGIGTLVNTVSLR